MSNKCLGVNKKEMDRLLSIYDNEPVVSVVYNYLDGDTSHIKTLDDILDVQDEKYESVDKASAQQEEVDNVPLSAFTYKEQLEIVDNIVYLAAWDEETKSVKEYEDIQFIDIEKVITDKMNSSDATYTDNYIKILEKDNLAELVNMAKAKLNRLGLTVDTEENPNDKNEGLGLTPSNQVNNKDKSSVIPKLMVSFLTTDTKSDVLGLAKFNDFNKTWKDLEVSLSSLPKGNTKDTLDRNDDFIEKMEKEAVYKPHYTKLINLLNNSPKNTVTQFVRAMDNYMINFHNEIIKIENRGVDGHSKKVMESGNDSNSKRLRGVWENNYFDKFTFVEGRAVVVDTHAAKTVLVQFDELRKRANKLDPSEQLDNATIGNALYMLNEIGIKMDRISLNDYLNTTNTNRVEAMKDLYSSLGDVFYKSRGGKGVTIEQLAKGDVKMTYNKFVTPMSTESSLNKLSEVQEKYTLSLTNTGILGPDGKMYHPVSQYDYATKLSVDVADSEKEVENLEDIYTKNSQYIAHFKDVDLGEERRKKLEFLTFLSRKNQGEDQGVSTSNISYVDEYSSRIDQMVIQRAMPYLTLADKSRSYLLKGLPFYPVVNGKSSKVEYDVDTIFKVNRNIKTIFAGYVVDELNAMKKAYDAIDNVDHSRLTANYHYKLDTDKEGNEFKNFEKGNVFKLQIFPSLSPGTDAAKELGLYNKSNGNKPFSIHGNYINEAGEFSVETSTLDRIRDHIAPIIDNLIETEYKKIKETLLRIDGKGKVEYNSLSDSITNKYLKVDGVYKTDQALDKGIADIAANYLVNGMISNVEYTKMFTGDIRYYKTDVDFLKRVPSTTATGDYLRITEGVNETFNIAISENFKYKSDFLSKEEHIENIQGLVEGIQNPHEKKAMLTSIEASREAYSDVNRTDAQAWITMSRFKELMIGLGAWQSGMNESYDRIMIPGKATAEDYTLFSKKMSTFQPKKGVHFEMIHDKYTGLKKPVYLKYSQAILFPDFIESNPSLKKMNDAMIEQGVSEVITGDGVKVGAIEATDIKANNIKFNTIELRNDHWKLQQDLPSKDKDTLVGSQLEVNITADLKYDENYGTRENPITGKELIENITNVSRSLSGRGFSKLAKEIGISEDGTIKDVDKLYNNLYETFEKEGETPLLLNQLRDRVPFDLIHSHRGQIYSKINGMFKSAAISIKQPGGSAIQLSDFGFDLSGKDFKTTKQLNKEEKSGIVWLKEDTKLHPPRYTVKKDENGNKIKEEVSAGQILLPYNDVAKMFGDDWDRVKSLPPSEIVKLIDKDALKIIGYRIPNQKLASNDSLEIVGILPPHAGSTVVAYSEITAKTGSDFDIDKMYYVKPAIRFNKDTGRVEVIKFLDDNNSTVKERYSNYREPILKRKEAVEALAKEDIDIKEVRKQEGDFEDSKLGKAISNINLSLFNITDPEEFINLILEEEGILMPIDEFSKLSIEEQNTTKALQSRRVELYRTVLESKHSFVRLISTVDGGDLENQIKYMLPTAKLEDLQIFGPTFQMETRRENISSKGGVAQIANHQSDNAISQYGGKKVTDSDKRLSKDGIIDLSNPFVKEYEVLEKDENDKLTGRVSEVLNNAIYITEVISTYMNAFVDAAKDNYIGRANFNFKTTNAALLMIRGGISPQKVNALMSQPSVKRFIQLEEEREGQAVPRNAKKPLDVVREEYNNAEFDNDSNIDSYSTVSLMKNVKNSDSSNDSEQLELLDLFLYARNLSKPFNDSIKMSKAPSKGGGTTLQEAYIMHYGKRNVGNTYAPNKEPYIVNWDNMFDGKMLGAYQNNGPDAIVKAVGPLSMMNTLIDPINYTYVRTFGKEIDDAKKVSKIYNLQFASIMAGSKAYSMTNDQLSEMLYGSDSKQSVPKRLKAIKDSKGYENNMFVQSLMFEPGLGRSPDFLKLNRLGGIDVVDNEALSKNWLALFNKEETKELAMDLAKYSFHTSALMGSSNTIFELVDHRILNEMGLSGREYNAMKTAPYSNEDLMDQVFRNSVDNAEIVPVVSHKGSISINKKDKKSTEKYFKVNKQSSPNLVIGYNTELDPVYKPYVSKSNTYPILDRHGRQIISGGEVLTETVKDLYKYEGNVVKDNVHSGVYVRVNKAGFSNNNGKVFEFKNKENKGKSIIPGNNRGLSLEMLETFRSLANPISPGLVDTRVVKFAEEMYESKEAEKAKSKDEVKPEDVNEDGEVFIKMKTNSGDLLSDLITADEWEALTNEEKEALLECASKK
jgi:hypothetical protein